MTFQNHKIWKQVPNNMLNGHMSNGHLKAIYAKYQSNLASGFREEDFLNFHFFFILVAMATTVFNGIGSF